MQQGTTSGGLPDTGAGIGSGSGAFAVAIAGGDGAREVAPLLSPEAAPEAAPGAISPRSFGAAVVCQFLCIKVTRSHLYVGFLIALGVMVVALLTHPWSSAGSGSNIVPPGNSTSTATWTPVPAVTLTSSVSASAKGTAEATLSPASSLLGSYSATGSGLASAGVTRGATGSYTPSSSSSAIVATASSSGLPVGVYGNIVLSGLQVGVATSPLAPGYGFQGYLAVSSSGQLVITSGRAYFDSGCGSGDFSTICPLPLMMSVDALNNYLINAVTFKAQAASGSIEFTLQNVPSDGDPMDGTITYNFASLAKADPYSEVRWDDAQDRLSRLRSSGRVAQVFASVAQLSIEASPSPSA